MVHVTCYFTSHPNTEDDVTMYFRKHADQFHDVHALDTAEVLALMTADTIDILVELAGHTQCWRDVQPPYKFPGSGIQIPLV